MQEPSPAHLLRPTETAARTRANWQRASGPAKSRSLLLLAMTFAGAAFNVAQAQPRPEIAGRWATQGFGSIVEFRPCAEAPGSLCGRILWLWEANDSQGRARTDRHNPDHLLKTRSLIGIELVRGLHETAPGVWGGGAFYNPDDGRTYDGEIRLKNGTLELRGCTLLVFCQTQTWRRPEGVIEAVKAAAGQ